MTNWDCPLSSELQQRCVVLAERLKSHDPVRGVWNAAPRDPSCSTWQVWCDASDIAFGAVLTLDGEAIEDCSWLRKPDDRRHINIAELEAAVQGITLAAKWEIKKFKLMTDTKTVAGWLSQLLNNTRRVRTRGLHELLVRRRLDIIDDMVETLGLTVEIVWIPSSENRADQLTRVPKDWLSLARSLPVESPDEVIAAASSTTLSLLSPITSEQIAHAQREDAEITRTVREIACEEEVTAPSFKKVRSQLLLSDGVLCRNLKLPLEGVTVPVIPGVLKEEAVRVAHANTGHASWETMYDLLRSECYFPDIAATCQAHVQQCARCACANARRGGQAGRVRADVPSRPWQEVVMDTLQIATDRSGQFHCVLVLVDAFSKWAEVVPLRHHDARSVAEAFSTVCLKWGPPDVVRVDNGTEFANAIVESLLETFGVRVRTGAVRHPQSQGSAERFNRTLLTMIRKVIEDSSTWKADLDVLLFYYRNRPHSSTGFAPVEAMIGWKPNQLVVQSGKPTVPLSAWVQELTMRTARIRDLVDAEMSTADFQEESVLCSYSVGDRVLLLRPERRQKCVPPFESGWHVSEVVSPSTVRIRRASQEKTVNVALIKPDLSDDTTERVPAGEDRGVPATLEVEREVCGPPPLYFTLDSRAEDTGRNLRDRSSLRPPERYQE